MKGKFGKIGIICLVLVLALGTLGVGFAFWSDTLTISGTVNTGELDWQLTSFSILDDVPGPNVPPADYTCNEDFSGIPQFWHSDKNVGWGEGTLVDTDGDGDYDTLALTLHNVYPCYFNAITVYAQNNGTIPLIIEKVVIDGSEITALPAPIVRLDLDADNLDDIEIWWRNSIGEELEVEEFSPAMTFWIHVLEDAPESETLSFTIGIVGVQWNAPCP